MTIFKDTGLDDHDRPSTSIGIANDSGVNVGILDYIEVLIKRKRSIAICTLAALIVSVAFSLLLKNNYTSTSIILPPQQDNPVLGMMLGQMGGSSGASSIASDLLGKGSLADMYASILKSEAIKDKIIDRFNLMDVYEQKFRLDTYKQLDNTTSIDVGKKDGLISISVVDKDPKRAAEMANAFVEEVGNLAVRMSGTGASQNRGFLEERLAKAKTDLARAEEKLKLFQSKNKAPDITEQAKGTIKGVADIMGQLAIEEVKLSTLRRQLTDNSQEVKTQKEIVRNLKIQIGRLEGSGEASSIPALGSVPSLGQEYVRIMREFKVQETLVELLTKQYELSSLSEANPNSTIQVIQKARIPDKKSGPKRRLIVMAATFVTFIGSILFCFFLEFIEEMPHNLKLRIRTLRTNLTTFRQKNVV